MDDLRDIAGLEPGAAQQSVPVSQVVSQAMKRSGRTRSIRGQRSDAQTIIASCNPFAWARQHRCLNRLRPQIEAMELPPGYQLGLGR